VKTKLIFVLAAVTILFGLYGLAGTLSSPKAEPKQVVKVVEKKVRTWRALNDVKRGQRVSRADMVIDMLPESEAHAIGIIGDVELTLRPGAVYSEDTDSGSLVQQFSISNPEDEGFVDLIIGENKVPYPIQVEPNSVVGGLIKSGTLVDILALTLPLERMSVDVSSSGNGRHAKMSVTPVLMGIKVLQVNSKIIEATRTNPIKEEFNLILELTRKQVATLTVAKRISEIEVHKSIGKYKPSELQADAGDVLSDFRSITEFRAGETVIK